MSRGQGISRLIFFETCSWPSGSSALRLLTRASWIRVSGEGNSEEEVAVVVEGGRAGRNDPWWLKNQFANDSSVAGRRGETEAAISGLASITTNALVTPR